MDKMKEGFTRSARRMRENLNYSVGLSERKDELQSVSHLEQRNQKMIAGVKASRQNLQACIRSGNKDDSLEKRKRRLEASAFGQQLQTDASEFTNTFRADETPVLGEVMKLIGQALDAITTERVLTDQYFERNIIDALAKYIDEEKALSKMKDKLARAAVDVEVARKRKLNAHDETKAQEIQDEYDDLQSKLENYKDNVYTGIYTLYSKQAEIANVYKEYVSAQMEYHRTALQKYENLLPDIDRKIASYPKRPVFGCHLEDHLRYTNRSIAVVLEVCCSALKQNYFHEKGLFRVNGNNNRIRRMKAAFDAHEIIGALPDSDEHVTDPHSICSVLKLYLRELPEPLLTHHLQADWVRTARLDQERRFIAATDLLSRLPEANRLNLAYLIRFLQLMLNYEKEIMMSVGNLSIVFGPNLLDTGGADSENMLGSKLVETFLNNADLLFPNDKFDFDYTVVSKQSASFSGSSDESRVSPRAIQVQSEIQQSNSSVGKNSSFRRSAVLPQTPPPRSRPKCPAPPPPAPNPSGLNQQLLTTLPEVLVQNNRIDTSSVENLSIAVCKSPSAGSSDSMGEYGSSNVEIGDELNAESSITQSASRPSRPPPPRNARRVSSPTEIESLQSGKRPVSYVNAVGSQEAIVAPPRRSINRQIGSVDENNRTVVHLETDNLQSHPSVTNCSSNSFPGPAVSMAAPVPKPRLPVKPKSIPDSPNEYTKL